MLVSELVKKLNAWKKENGDLPVKVIDTEVSNFFIGTDVFLIDYPNDEGFTTELLLGDGEVSYSFDQESA